MTYSLPDDPRMGGQLGRDTIPASTATAISERVVQTPPRYPRTHRVTASAGAGVACAAAFTILELLVVIGIIGLILALGLPAFNTMSRDSRLDQARQFLSSTMSRAALIASSERSLMAVRALPAQWLYPTGESEDAGATQETTVGRQALVTYRYITASSPPADAPVNVQGHVMYSDYFKQASSAVSVLPKDVWVAPSEALVPTTAGRFDGDAVLRGTIGDFELDPDPRTNPSEQFLDADDFLIVFDPEQGVRSTVWLTGNAPRPPAWRLYAFDPETPALHPEGRGWERTGDRWNGVTRDFDIKFQRYHFGGVTLYQREPFANLGPDAAPDARRDALRQFGETYAISRFGGNLMRSEPPPEQ